MATPWREAPWRRGMSLAVVVVSACADFDATLDPAFGLSDTIVARPTLARDVQPIFDKRCAFGGCHSRATRQGGLTLVAGDARDALVGRRSRLRQGATLAVAGDTSASWLLVVLGSDEGRRGGFARMPLAAAPLTPNQLATIANWIATGAPE